MPAVDWQQRYLQQSVWTADLRAYLLQRSGLSAALRILEVGCGAGAVTSGLHNLTSAHIFGLDIDPLMIETARLADPDSSFTCGNGLSLPYPLATFDGVVCHFFLLWVKSPQQALVEMRRVCHPGGAVVAFAEPDYGARLDYPPALAELGRLQAESLQKQGANPSIGRQLSALFHQCGLLNVETGLLGGQWREPPAPAAQDLEWQVIASDLQNTLPAERLSELHRLDQLAWDSGERVLFVPTFYAWGVVP